MGTTHQNVLSLDRLRQFMTLTNRDNWTLHEDEDPVTWRQTVAGEIVGGKDPVWRDFRCGRDVHPSASWCACDMEWRFQVNVHIWHERCELWLGIIIDVFFKLESVLGATIAVDQTDPIAFERMLYFMYTGKLHLNRKNALDMYFVCTSVCTADANWCSLETDIKWQRWRSYAQR